MGTLFEVNSTTGQILCPGMISKVVDANLDLEADGTGFIDLKSGTKFQTSGGTASALNYYEEGTHNTGWDGIWGLTTVTGNIPFVRIGKMITITIPKLLASASVATVISIVEALPPRLRPSVGQEAVGIVQDDGTEQLGRFSLSTGGIITISASAAAANFLGTSGSGDSGIVAVSFTYRIS